MGDAGLERARSWLRERMLSNAAWSGESHATALVALIAAARTDGVKAGREARDAELLANDPERFKRPPGYSDDLESLCLKWQQGQNVGEWATVFCAHDMARLVRSLVAAERRAVVEFLRSAPDVQRYSEDVWEAAAKLIEGGSHTSR